MYQEKNGKNQKRLVQDATNLYPKKIRTLQMPTICLSRANLRIKNKKSKFFRHFFCFYVIFAVLLYYERDKNILIRCFDNADDGVWERHCH